MPNPVAFLTTSSLDFGEYGDFQLIANDLKTINEPIKARMQALKDLIKTSFGDYYYLRRYGTDLESYIGKGMDSSIQASIENSLKQAVINENIFDSKEFSIYSIINGNTLYIRIFIFEGEAEETTLNITYDTTTGVELGY